MLGVSIYFIEGIGVLTYFAMIGATLGTDEDIFKGSVNVTELLPLNLFSMSLISLGFPFT
jgi:hypothetical protein